MGNISCESGFDPTSVEGIFNEKFQIGSRKNEMFKNPSGYCQKLWSDYASVGISINEAQYRGADGQY